jgi:WD40 repeat protein
MRPLDEFTVLVALDAPAEPRTPPVLMVLADQTLREWEPGVEEKVVGTLPGGAGRIAFAADGQRLALAFADRSVRLWDLGRCAEVVCLHGADANVQALAFTPDGRQVACASADGVVRVWGTDDSEPLGVPRGGQDPIRQAAFARDGSRLVAALAAPVVGVWDAVTAARVADLRRAPRLAPTAVGKVGDTGHECVAFSPGGLLVAAGGSAGEPTVRVWDVASGREVACLQGHADGVAHIQFLAEGRRLVSSSYDCTVRVWEVASGKELVCQHGHESQVVGARSVRQAPRLAVAPDGAIIATGTEWTVLVWDAATGDRVAYLRQPAEVSALALAPDGKRLAAGTHNGTVHLWSLRPPVELGRLAGHVGKVERLAFTPDGQCLVSHAAEGAVLVRDVRTGAAADSCQGVVDVAAVAADRPCWAAVGSLETSVIEAATGAALAWFPSTPESLTTHPGGRTWAGVRGTHLSLFTLEGAPPADEPPQRWERIASGDCLMPCSDLAEGVVVEPGPADRVVLWLRGQAGTPPWTRVVNPWANEASDGGGVRVAVAVLTPFREKAPGLLGRLWPWGQPAPGEVRLPNNRRAVPEGSHRDAYLAWSADPGRPLTEGQIAEWWPERDGCRRLGTNLFLLTGVQLRTRRRQVGRSPGAANPP